MLLIRYQDKFSSIVLKCLNTILSVFFFVCVYCVFGLSNIELKAEIEKLKAAQKSAQNTDPEKYRRYLQEITCLRVKLHQQERDIAEMQRWGSQKHLLKKQVVKSVCFNFAP